MVVEPESDAISDRRCSQFRLPSLALDVWLQAVQESPRLVRSNEKSSVALDDHIQNETIAHFHLRRP